MFIRLTKRPAASTSMAYISPLIAFGFTIIAGVGLFYWMGVNPAAALYVYFISPLNSVYGWAELGLKATPLILIAAALSIGFRGGVWNIGAEGQLILGGIGGGGLALLFYDSQSNWLLPAMLLGGLVSGMAWAAIPALLKTKFNTNEILTSLMLTYVAALLLGFLVHGPWRDPHGFNFPESRLFSDSALLPILFDETRLHIGTPIALIAVVITWILMTRTIIGFQIKVIGNARPAGRYAGFNMHKITWFCLLVSGGAAGLAGVMEVAGPIGQLLPTISPGYGFTAIIVAFVGRLHPFGVLCAGLLLALSYLGGENAQIALNLPLAVTGVFQGLLLFFLLACDVLIYYRVSFISPIKKYTAQKIQGSAN